MAIHGITLYAAVDVDWAWIYVIIPTELAMHGLPKLDRFSGSPHDCVLIESFACAS